jgi:hypothetical protein
LTTALLFGFLGVIFLAATFINMMTAPPRGQERPVMRRGWPSSRRRWPTSR